MSDCSADEHEQGIGEGEFLDAVWSKCSLLDLKICHVNCSEPTLSPETDALLRGIWAIKTMLAANIC